MKSRLFSLFKFFIGWPLSVIAIIFLVKLIAPQSSKAFSTITHIDGISLFLSVLAFLAYYFLRSYLWQQILAHKGHHVPLHHTAWLWGISELKRFVPGNVWAFIGRTTAFSTETLSKKSILSGIIFETEYVFLGSFIGSLIALPLVKSTILLHTSYADILVWVTIGVVIICTIIFLGAERFLAKFPQFIRHIIPHFSFSTNLSLVALSVVTLLFFGLGTYFSIAAIAILPLKNMWSFVGLAIFSFFAGYASIVTPMGLGVREAVLTAGLSSTLAVSLAGICAIFSRLVLILTEIIFLILAYGWHRVRTTWITTCERFISEHKQETLLGALMMIYIAYYLTASILRYQNFYAGRFDLGNMDQTVWNTLHGRIFQLTDPDGTAMVSRLSIHADFILILLSPFYAIWSDPRMLLIIQTIILACGAVFIFLISKEVLKSKNIAVVLSLIYLANPAIGFTNLFDFHAVTLATTFLLGAWYFLIKRKYVWHIIFLLFAALTKEQLWITAALFGLYICFIDKKRILGLTITLISSIIFWFVFFIAIPTLHGGQHFALSYYSDFGSSPSSVIKNIFLSPNKTISLILQHDRVNYLHQLFSPLGYLSLAAPFFIIFALPDFAIDFLGNNPLLHQIYYQYSAVISPFIFISAIYGIRNIRKFFPKLSYTFFAYYLIGFTLRSILLYGPTPPSRDPNLDMFVKPHVASQAIDNFLSHIPRRYRIAATNNIGSHISRRRNIYTLPQGLDKANIVVILLNDTTSWYSPNDQAKIVQRLQQDSNYHQVFHKADFYVFEKKGTQFRIRL